MPDSVIDTVNKWRLKYQKEKKKKMAKFVDRLKCDFAWENDEYDIPEEALTHPEIDAEFPRVLLNGNEEHTDYGLDDHDETEEEQVRRVSQTTGVPAHGAAITGVGQNVAPDNGPTIIVMQQNIEDEGDDEEQNDDNDAPQENEDDDSDSADTTPENPLLEADLDNDDGEQDGVLPDDVETQGENTHAEGTIFDQEGVRRSTRHRRAPSSYVPSKEGNKYQYQGTVNLSIPEYVKYRKFTETDQMIHVLGVALVQTHGLHKGIKLFGQEGKTQCRKRCNSTTAWKLTILLTPRHLHMNKDEKPLSQCVISSRNDVDESKLDNAEGGTCKRNLRHTRRRTYMLPQYTTTL